MTRRYVARHVCSPGYSPSFVPCSPPLVRALQAGSKVDVLRFHLGLSRQRSGRRFFSQKIMLVASGV